MKIVLVTTVVLVSAFSQAWAGDGDAVVTGYLVTGTTKCLDAAGTGLETPTTTNQDDLAAKCIRLLVEETATGTEYLIKKSDKQTDILVLVDTAAPTYNGMGTAIQFSDDSNIKDAATTVADITNSGAPVRIQLAGKTAGVESCLTDAPDYKESGCGNVDWYFIAAACQVSGCATCNADATLCDTCTANTHVISADKKKCQACSAAIPDCNDCTVLTTCQACDNSKAPSTDKTKCVTCGVASCDTCSADGVCDVCTGSLKPNGVGSGCFDCSGVANCEKCEAAGQCSGCSTGMIINANKACEACTSGKSASTDGTKCVACSGITGCESCSADNVCGKCTGSLLPNDNGSACYDCSTITNCEKCKANGECSACSSGMGPNAKGDACVATTPEATTASDAGINTVSVLAIVGMALFTMA